MNEEVKDCLIVCQTSEGVDIHATLTKLSRYFVVFEIYGPGGVLRASEALNDFKIIIRNRTVYSGRATIRTLVSTGQIEVCEATLNEGSWMELEFTPAMTRNGELGEKFNGFIREWQKLYKIRPEYKIIVADMQTFFMDLQLWLDQVELGIRASPAADRSQLEEEAANQLARPLIPCVNTLFEKFEDIAMGLEEEVRQAHRNYMRRQLHSLILCAPFAHRTFVKPLGYAGDYEMVNMIIRNGHEGGSLYAKLVNKWFLQQPPAEAHRNRVQYLKTRLLEETARAARGGQPARILNLGCGPAGEVREFLKESPLSDNARFTLLDFNDETIEYARVGLRGIKTEFKRNTGLQFQKKSVLQLLKEAVKPAGDKPRQQYELVYCAGLFDYLTDRTCKQLMDIFYEWTAPGGLLIATNVEPANPLRNGMEHLLDWNLIYRTAAQMRLVKPQEADRESVNVFSDSTGVNVLLEVRKPQNGG
jgi:extracellular factor (EF) 3-hydroxypalmitic acid methyl ester biosynthesis protein